MRVRINSRKQHAVVVFLAGISAVSIIVLATICVLTALLAVPFELALGVAIAFAAACAAMIRALVDLLPRLDNECERCNHPRYARGMLLATAERGELSVPATPLVSRSKPALAARLHRKRQPDQAE